MIKWIVVLLFIVISGQFAISNIKLLQNGVALDFTYFYEAGERVLNKDNPYVLYKGGLIRNPPFTLLIYAALSFLPISISQYVWFLLSFMAFLFGSYCLYLILEKNNNERILKNLPWYYYLMFFSLVFIFFPFRYNLASGQLANFLYFCIAAALYYTFNKQQFRTSIFIAIASLLKVTPILLLTIFLFQKKFKTILLIIINILILSILAALILGVQIYKNYLAVTGSYFDTVISGYYNQSLSGFLFRTFHLQNPNIIVNTLFLITLSCIYLYYSKILKKIFTDQIILWNLLILSSLMFPSFSWQHYFSLSIFPLFTTFYMLLKFRSSFAIFIILFLSYLLMAINIKNPIILENMGILGAISLSHVFLGSLVLFLLNFYLLKSRVRSTTVG